MEFPCLTSIKHLDNGMWLENLYLQRLPRRLWPQPVLRTAVTVSFFHIFLPTHFLFIYTTHTSHALLLLNPWAWEKIVFPISFFLLFYFLTLQYCIGFAIYQNESAPGIHVFPILNPPPSPYHPSGSSQCTSPKHPVLCIEPGLATRFIYDIICVSMPFSQIIPPSSSPTESKRLFYTSVSLLLSCIQVYCYHLSKFHIYALVYCIGVFLSGLLHSV